MTRVRKYSASQLTLYRRCPRSWWFGYIAGYKTPPGASQALGSSIHKAIETFLLTGVLPEDRRALAALETLAEADAHALKETLHVEGSITIPLDAARDGTPRSFVGFIDLFDDADKTRPEITDHKTTSDMKYAKTTYELAEDVQLIAYAKWAIDRLPEAVDVRLAHNVIPTKGAPKAVITSVVVDRAHVESRWASYLPILDEMDTAHGLTNAADVAPTGLKNGECTKYGGCPHAARCASAIFRTETINPAETADTTAPQAQETTKMSAITDKLAAIRARTNPIPAAQVEPVKAETAHVEAKTEAPVSDAKAKLAALRARVAPKVAEHSQSTLHSAEALAAAARGDVAGAERIEAEQRKETPSAQVAEDFPTKLPTEEPAPQVERENDGGPVVIERDPTKIDLLLVDVSGDDATPIEVIVEPILAEIRKNAGMSWQLIDFGKGAGFVTDGLRLVKTWPATVAVNSSTRLGQVALEVLRPLARRTFHSIR